MPSKRELGERIKRFRLERGLTLKEVELEAKVSATHVSEIERGMTSPTVGALAKIAKALGTEPSYFLQNNAYPPVSVVRKAGRRVLYYSDWGANVSCLSNGISRSKMSFLEVELQVEDREGGGGSQEVEPLRHTGEELIHILRGVVEMHIGSNRHLLKEGDSIHFRSSEPHTIRNIGDGNARLLWVASPPFQL